MKLLKNKKGLELPGTLVDIASYFVFIFIVLVFFILFLIHGCTAESRFEAQFNSAEAALDLNTELLALLNTPAANQYLFSDIALLSLYNASYDSQLNNIFNQAFSNRKYIYAFKVQKGELSTAIGNHIVARYAAGASVEIISPDFAKTTFTLYRLTEEEMIFYMNAEAGYYA